MKVNNTMAKDDFSPICEACDHPIHENPIYYLEMDGDGVQTRYGFRERQYVHKHCLGKVTPHNEFI